MKPGNPLARQRALFVGRPPQPPQQALFFFHRDAPYVLHARLKQTIDARTFPVPERCSPHPREPRRPRRYSSRHRF